MNMLPLPDSKGLWKKVYMGEETEFDVYFINRGGKEIPFATNKNQTDPCQSLSADGWIKISNDWKFY